MGVVAGESAVSVCEGQCGWSGGRERVCLVTHDYRQQREVRARWSGSLKATSVSFIFKDQGKRLGFS